MKANHTLTGNEIIFSVILALMALFLLGCMMRGFYDFCQWGIKLIGG